MQAYVSLLSIGCQMRGLSCMQRNGVMMHPQCGHASGCHQGHHYCCCGLPRKVVANLIAPLANVDVTDSLLALRANVRLRVPTSHIVVKRTHLPCKMHALCWCQQRAVKPRHCRVFYCGGTPLGHVRAATAQQHAQWPLPCDTLPGRARGVPSR